MEVAISETYRRRNIQIKYNDDNNINPCSTKKIAKRNLLTEKMDEKVNFDINEEKLSKMSKKHINALKKKIKKEMQEAAKHMNYIKADKLKEKLTFIDSYFLKK